MNTKNQTQNTEQEQQQSDSMEEGFERLAEANPDDFSAEGELMFDARSSTSNDVPNPDWNPDDFSAPEQQNQ